MLFGWLQAQVRRHKVDASTHIYHPSRPQYGLNNLFCTCLVLAICWLTEIFVLIWQTHLLMSKSFTHLIMIKLEQRDVYLLYADKESVRMSSMSRRSKRREIPNLATPKADATPTQYMLH